MGSFDAGTPSPPDCNNAKLDNDPEMAYKRDCRLKERKPHIPEPARVEFQWPVSGICSTPLTSNLTKDIWVSQWLSMSQLQSHPSTNINEC